MASTNTSDGSPDVPGQEPGGKVGRQRADEPVESWALFGTARQLLIKHDDETYRLQITRSNKLILTK